MHAYTWPGDTWKQILGWGDILGIQKIYGELPFGLTKLKIRNSEIPRFGGSYTTVVVGS